MKPRILLAAAVLALAACATTSANLDQTQKRLVSAIQSAQKTSTAALNAQTITLRQDQDAQAKLLAARRDVMAAKSVDEAEAAAKAAGVQP